jgi:uncharacterized protein YecE (DUF72 family)
MAKVLIGTASWSDPEFVRDWYPKGLRAADRLPYYAERFDLVELNSSFYAIPEAKVAEQWVRATPARFLFDVKLHQLLSRHSCQLKMLPKSLQRVATTMGKGRVVLDPDLERAAVEEFLRGIEPLEAAGKLGLLLLQLSPAFSPRNSRLDDLEPMLGQLAPRPVAVELRNRNWVVGAQLEQTTRFLAERRATLVAVDAPRSEHFSVMPALHAVTNPTAAYLRLHGRNEHAYLTGRTVAERFDYDYSDDELQEVKERVAGFAEQAQVVHVVFNNNRSDYAPEAALRFRRIMGQAVPAAARPPRVEQKTLEI